MENKNIERLITDLKKLPKEKAPENFEEKLLLSIQNYELNKDKKKEKKFSFFDFLFNPILAPALSIVLVVFVLILNLSHSSIYQPEDLKGIKNFIDEKPTKVTGTLNSQKPNNFRSESSPAKSHKTNENPPFEIGSGVNLDTQPIENNYTTPGFIQETGYPPHPVQSMKSTENQFSRSQSKDLEKVDTLQKIKNPNKVK